MSLCGDYESMSHCKIPDDSLARGSTWMLHYSSLTHYTQSLLPNPVDTSYTALKCGCF